MQGDRQVSLSEAARLTGLQRNTIRNHVYSGKIKRASQRGYVKKSNGVAKRGEKIRVWLSDLVTVYGLKIEE